MADERELRRRAQPLLDRPPYEPLPIDELRERAGARSQRARRRLVAGVGVLLVAVGTVGVVARLDEDPDNRVVTVATTAPDATLPPVTAPRSTTIADLRFTPIDGPDGVNRVDIHAAGDQFLAIEGDEGVERAWIGDAAGEWREISVPTGLRGVRIGTVAQFAGRFVVVGDNNDGPVVLEGASLDRLKVSQWKTDHASVPAAINPAPPRGNGIAVNGSVDTIAVGENGIVMVGRVYAGVDRELLPQSVREMLRRQPGRIDVRDGRVVVTIGGFEDPPYDQPARSLGLTAAEVEYLSVPDGGRSHLAVWGAAWGEPLRQLAATGIGIGHYGNFVLARVFDGFVLTAPTNATSEMWWSRDGLEWLHLASPPRQITADDAWLVELGSRWVVPSAGGVSDDHGRSWRPIDLSGDVARRSGTGSLLGSRGSSAFGLLAGSTPLDAATVTTFAGRLLYSPDGEQWSSFALDEILDFEANVPAIAVGDRSAILEAGLRAPGVQPQRFWLIRRG